MNSAQTLELIDQEILAEQSRRKQSLDKVTASDAKLSDLHAARRVIERLLGIKDQPIRQMPHNQNTLTNAQAVLIALGKFGPLSTSELLEKLNSGREKPTTSVTIGVTASRLKSDGKLSHDGKRWVLKKNEAQTESSASAPKVTDEAETSSNDGQATLLE